MIIISFNYYCFIFIFGCCLGSTSGVIAERLPMKQPIFFTHSQCIHCKKKLAFIDLIPIISCLIQGFHCRYCLKQLPSIYLVEELLGGFFSLLVLKNGIDFSSFYIYIFLLQAFLLSLTDFLYWKVEPKILYPLFLFLLSLHLFLNQTLFWKTGIGIFLLFTCFTYFTNNSMGYGDVILLSCWSILLGHIAILHIIFLASINGLLFCIINKLLFKKNYRKIPFVPFLSIGLFFYLYI